MREIRFLVENYYDIQKLRVETFNRIVMFIKTNKNDILKNLSHYEFETHDKRASHHQIEPQGSHAIELLKKKKYAEFVKKYVLSHSVLETQPNNASQRIGGTQLVGALSQIQNLVWFHNKLYETEKELYIRLDAWSKGHKLRNQYLDHVKGIGKVLASGIIAWLSEPILRADNVSQIWKYCGLFPGSERKAGKKLEYNPRLKSFCWKIGQSFIKFKCFGRKLYDDFKEEAKQKHPDWSKLHIHNYVRRKVVKLFIASVWEVWRKMNNLPVTEPYPIVFLEHQTKILPEMWIEKKGEDV
jgi:hypothetical protein